MSQGWECPKCGRVYAPWMAQCTACPGQTFTASFMICTAHDFGEPQTLGRQCRRCGYWEPPGLFQTTSVTEALR